MTTLTKSKRKPRGKRLVLRRLSKPLADDQALSGTERQRKNLKPLERLVRPKRKRRKYQWHGMSRTPEWDAWRKMRYRCNNPNDPYYSYYGGRGIKICERWKKFKNFYEDMGPRPEETSLDRIDNDGDYEPENCRWATRFEQAQNKRVSINLTFNGVTKNAAEWARELGMKPQTLRGRLYLGWSVEKALLTPVKKRIA